MRHFSRGFTLIELLVVVAIIGILSAVGVVSYSGYKASAEMKKAEISLNTIYLAEQEYKSNNGEYYYNASTSNIVTNLFDGIDDLSEGTYESVNEAKIAFVNDKLVGDRIQKSGLLPLLGDNNVSLNPNKVKFTRELRDTLVKLYKKYSSLTIK